MVKFIDIVTKIFDTYGFKITSTSEYSKYIFASKDNVSISIGYKDPQDSISMDDLRKFLKSSKKDRTNRRIYICAGDFPEDITKFAHQKDIQLWDKEKLEYELGKAMIADVIAPKPDAGEVGSTKSFFELLEQKPTVESKPEEPSYDLGVSIPTVPISDMGEDSTKKGSGEEDEEEYRIIKSRITQEEASKMAKKVMGGFRFDLELIPYYIYNYSCDINIGGRTPPQRNTGTIGINGLTNNMEEWPPIFETVTELGEDYTRLPPKFTEEEAYTAAYNSIIILNTKTIETKEEKDSAIIIEKKQVEPKPDAIEISKKGLVYLPAWCIEGSNGVMIIDATTGKVLKEDIFKG